MVFRGALNSVGCGGPHSVFARDAAAAGRRSILRVFITFRGAWRHTGKPRLRPV